MRTDQPQHGNKHLDEALTNVERVITRLYANRAQSIKDRNAEIERLNVQITEAEDAKKYLKRAQLNESEALRYLET
jgi:hypothetical protein